MARPLAPAEVAYRAELDHLDDATPCKCGDCGATWRYDQLAQIGDCSLTPGDPSPAGRCADPRCASPTYRIDRWTKRSTSCAGSMTPTETSACSPEMIDERALRMC